MLGKTQRAWVLAMCSAIDLLYVQMFILVIEIQWILARSYTHWPIWIYVIEWSIGVTRRNEKSMQCVMDTAHLALIYISHTFGGMTYSWYKTFIASFCDAFDQCISGKWGISVNRNQWVHHISYSDEMRGLSVVSSVQRNRFLNVWLQVCCSGSASKLIQII